MALFKDFYLEALDDIAKALREVNMTLIQLNNSLCDVMEEKNKKK